MCEDDIGGGGLHSCVCVGGGRLFFKGIKSRICDGVQKSGTSEKPQSLMGNSAHPLSVGAVFLPFQ